MKTTLSDLIEHLPALSFIVMAGILALHDKPGWIWFSIAGFLLTLKG